MRVKTGEIQEKSATELITVHCDRQCSGLGAAWDFMQDAAPGGSQETDTQHRFVLFLQLLVSL